MDIHDSIQRLQQSRGWTPELIPLPWEVEGLAAAGAELKNRFCVGKGQHAILSPPIGDLKSLETYEAYQEAFLEFLRIFRVEPKLIACDLHPDYLSTRFAKGIGAPIITIQHHHAHIAACMAEHGLDEPVIGISFDGTGLGDDQQVWGGEFLICDRSGYQRFSHLAYVPLPGGDKAAEEPWRMGISYLYRVFGRAFLDDDLPFIRQLDQGNAALLLQAIDKQINCPNTSSIGRLFDAVAAIINLVTISTFEAEAPIRLESIIDLSLQHSAGQATYSYRVGETVIVDDLIAAVVNDLHKHIPKSVIAAKFHNTIVAIIVNLAERMRQATGINNVVLSGGVFQNRYLLTHAAQQLSEKAFAVFRHAQTPTSDSGICLGQLVIAAKGRKH